MNALQEKLLEMFDWLSKFLEKNNLRYYVIGGTMLGAVRHQGFIPWDDDIDIALPRRDYEKLISLLSTVHDHYIIESPRSLKKDYLYPISKFYDINTTMKENTRRGITRGVFIDIFPLDGIGNTLENAMKNYKKVDRLNMFLAMKSSKVRKKRKWWKNLAIILGTIIPVNSKKLSKKLDTLCSKYDYDDSLYVGNLTSTYRNIEIMPKSIFGNPTKYKFENLIVTGPEKYNEYLTKLFGDWKKLPSENQRESSHDFSNIKFDISYFKNNEN